MKKLFTYSSIEGDHTEALEVVSQFRKNFAGVSSARITSAAIDNRPGEFSHTLNFECDPGEVSVAEMEAYLNGDGFFKLDPKVPTAHLVEMTQKK